MFEQPEPTPDVRDRRNMRVARLVGGLLLIVLMQLITGQNSTRQWLRFGVPAAMLALIFGPIVIGRWLARRPC